MKRLTFLATALASLFFAASCQQEENLEPVAQGTTVKFQVEVPGGMDTKAVADGKNVDVLHYAIYKYDHDDLAPDDSGHANAVQNSESTPLASGVVDKANSSNDVSSFNIQFDLLVDQNYVAIFWAQVADPEMADGENSYYDLGDLRTISLKNPSTAKGNQEDRAAFFRTYEFNTTTVQDHKVTLYRPFAQLNLGTTKESLQPKQTDQSNGTTDGAFDIDVVSSKVIVKGLSTSFNTIDKLYDGEDYEEICGNANARTEVAFEFDKQEVITKDKQTMVADSFAMWRISDPKKFISSLNGSITTATGRIEYLVYNAMKNEIYEAPQVEVIEVEVEKGFATSGNPIFTPFGDEQDWN